MLRRAIVACASGVCVFVVLVARSGPEFAEAGTVRGAGPTPRWELHQTVPVGPFYGHYPTCWHRWPPCWPKCPNRDCLPVEGELVPTPATGEPPAGEAEPLPFEIPGATPDIPELPPEDMPLEPLPEEPGAAESEAAEPGAAEPADEAPKLDDPVGEATPMQPASQPPMPDTMSDAQGDKAAKNPRPGNPAAPDQPLVEPAADPLADPAGEKDAPEAEPADPFGNPGASRGNRRQRDSLGAISPRETRNEPNRQGPSGDGWSRRIPARPSAVFQAPPETRRPSAQPNRDALRRRPAELMRELQRAADPLIPSPIERATAITSQPAEARHVASWPEAAPAGGSQVQRATPASVMQRHSPRTALPYAAGMSMVPGEECEPVNPARGLTSAPKRDATAGASAAPAELGPQMAQPLPREAATATGNPLREPAATGLSGRNPLRGSSAR